MGTDEPGYIPTMDVTEVDAHFDTKGYGYYQDHEHLDYLKFRDPEVEATRERHYAELERLIEVSRPRVGAPDYERKIAERNLLVTGHTMMMPAIGAVPEEGYIPPERQDGYLPPKPATGFAVVQKGRRSAKTGRKITAL